MISIPFEEHLLENGLRVVLSPEPAVPVVAVNLWYGVGSRNETEGKTGLAHFFEHMMFQGSRHVPANRHFELLEGVGGSANATTWFDRTNYYETVPAHHLDLALWLEADRMGWMLPALTSEKLDNQREVVKNERRQRYDNQPYGDWDERMLAMVYPPGHPYRHPVIGFLEDIEGYTLEDVERFFRIWYAPDNAVLTLCGSFDPESALERVKRYFGEIPPGTGVRAVPADPGTGAAPGGNGRQVVEAEVPLVRVYVGVAVPAYGDPGFYAADIAGDVLGKGRASRLHRALVLERQLAKDVMCWVMPLMTGAGMMLVQVTGKPGVKAGVLEAAVFEEMEGLETMSRAEVARAQAMGETAVLEELERVSRRADLLSMFTMHFGDPGRLAGEIDRLRAVTPEQVADFAATGLAADRRKVLTYVPERPV